MAQEFTRPEWAIEILPAGALAARRQPGSGQLQAAAFVPFDPGAAQASFAPYLDKDAPKIPLPGIAESAPARAGVASSIRRALEQAGARDGVVTLVLPDTAVRVLMLDFDSIPDKASDALPVLRFRLRKLVPFDVDDSAVSYQVLSGAGTSSIRVMAAVIPNPLLHAYEAAVREAGFEPGVVLPSTLAALGLLQDDRPALLVHATEQYVTTAISRGNDLLLHRTHELPSAAPAPPSPQEVREALEFLGEVPSPPSAMQDIAAESSVDGLSYAPIRDDDEGTLFPLTSDPVENPLAATGYEAYLHAAAEPPPVSEVHTAEEPAYLPDEGAFHAESEWGHAGASTPSEAVSERDEELINALTVAVAFYEDLAGSLPNPVRVAGTLDALGWHALMRGDRTVEEQDLSIADLADAGTLGTAAPSGISRAQLAAICGALAG